MKVPALGCGLAGTFVCNAVTGRETAAFPLHTLMHVHTHSPVLTAPSSTHAHLHLLTQAHIHPHVPTLCVHASTPSHVHADKLACAHT